MPSLYVVATEAWPAHLAKENVSAWYCRVPGALPRGYSRQDGVGGPSSGDRIVLREDIAVRAKDAARQVSLGAPRTVLIPEDRDALDVAIHEYLHCCVRLDANQVDLPEDVVKFSHPAAPLPGFWHAVKRLFPQNAFTGLLRWRQSPAKECKQAILWLMTEPAQRFPA